MDSDAGYEITREAGAVRLSGEFDITARDELRSMLLQAIAENRATDDDQATDEDGTAGVVVDFAGVTFLDSEAMGALIDGLNAGRAAGVKLSIVNAHGIVNRVLEVSGVLELFQ
ncbi:STAS domain-containing protein [Couchioplanes azureus]|uniref:STAS domain-containing protein n=1 Tax=Couchioplanes caeruleus TaxID=56438 RepID=UPI00167094B0|nr:STAS domain-containing protein [Couchioplanes caeruleus]